ncbi:MAG: hypothetical protein U0670_16480 [Anaerolineae bacterium]
MTDDTASTFLSRKSRSPLHGQPLLVRLLIVFGAIAICAYMVIDFARLAQIAFNGASADGVYLRRWTGSPNNSLHIEYRFTVDGVDYTNSAWVRGDLYDRAPTMAALPVIYARNNPALSVLDGVNIWEFLLKGGFTVLIVLGGIGAFLQIIKPQPRDG